jgi:hypothetical protein
MLDVDIWPVLLIITLSIEKENAEDRKRLPGITAKIMSSLQHFVFCNPSLSIYFFVIQAFDL